MTPDNFYASSVDDVDPQLLSESLKSFYSQAMDAAKSRKAKNMNMPSAATTSLAASASAAQHASKMAAAAAFTKHRPKR